MANLTTKELNAISELLESETVLIKKSRHCAEKTTDPALKSLYEKAAKRHMDHYSKIRGLLG